MHKLKILGLSALAALTLTACLDDAARVAIVATKYQNDKSEHPEIGSHYVHDHRTNLCFLVSNGNMTNVPCTPEVLAEVARLDAAKGIPPVPATAKTEENLLSVTKYSDGNCTLNNGPIQMSVTCSEPLNAKVAEYNKTNPSKLMNMDELIAFSGEKVIKN